MFPLIIAIAASPLGATASQPSPVAVPQVVSVRPSGRAEADDPEKLPLAREIWQAFLPPGAIQKMMGSLSETRSGMMSEMLNRTPKELGAKGAKDSDKSLGELVRERDPYFEQRMEITNRVVMEEIGKVMAGFEPELREDMAKVYARHFTKTELTDLANFLRTPSGKSFASQLMLLMSDPEYQLAMKSLTPKILQAMPGIMEKVKKATAQLPPPKNDEKPQPANVPPT